MFCVCTKGTFLSHTLPWNLRNVQFFPISYSFAFKSQPHQPGVDSRAYNASPWEAAAGLKLSFARRKGTKRFLCFPPDENTDLTYLYNYRF